MHILTGMLLSLLLGKKKLIPQKQTMSFHGIIEMKHLLPGRLRVHVPKLVGNTELKNTLLEQVSSLKDIHSIEINTITGSILITHDPEKIEAPLLFALLIRLLGLEDDVRKMPVAGVTKGIQGGLETVNRGIYEYSRGILDLHSLLPVLLVGFGLYRMIRSPQNRFPAGFTFLWWALALLNRGGDGR